MTPAVIQRLKERVSVLQGRVYGAASLAALMREDAPPNVTPCAHVVPTGLRARADDEAATGAFVQSYDLGFTVVVSLRAHDQAGERLVMDEVLPLFLAVARALAGWSPDDETVGVFVLRQAFPAVFARGVAVYEVQFAIQDQLRISP